MYFGTKSYLKSNRNHTAKHTLITKLNFNQFNISKNKIDENDFEKKYYKKTQKKLEKNHVRKNCINP
jgi:translation elongation factor EF-1alpha